MIQIFLRFSMIVLLGLSSTSFSAERFMSRDEKQLLEISGAKYVLPGEYLKAWQAAVGRFRRIKQIPPSMRNLQMYDVLFSETESLYMIEFLPRTDLKGHSLMERGAMDTIIRIRKSDYRVYKVTFGQM